MLLSLFKHYLDLYISDTVLKVSQSLYCFTTSICHGVENYFPRLWRMGICDAIFLSPVLRYHHSSESCALPSIYTVSTTGHYCEEGYIDPFPCPRGTYMPEGVTPGSAGTGTEVLVGTPAQRQFECLDCPAGQYCENEATITPTNCGLGKYSEAGQQECQDCELG